ncbi:MAG TPA: FAD-dependent oxidoreductase, partial [Candidatus Sulfotelmatobacter sp.]|nr:FAD-dependent oxidoreductase [Candidatus Sulfotelmatobacter sp.]
MPKIEKVVVVGGGFGGVKTALELANDPRFSVTLLSNDHDMKYYPTIYKEALGVSKANSIIPLVKIFEGSNVNLAYGQAKAVDRKAKTITTVDGTVYTYDCLVLSLGVVTNYFNIPGLSEYAYGIKSTEEAAKFKKHLHEQLIDEGKPDLNYVIVGAGPTGIELAGALPDYLREVMRRHGINNKRVNIGIVEALPRLLPNMPKDISKKVKRRLNKLGIRLYLGEAVKGESADKLTLGDKELSTHTVIWTAGVTNNPFYGENNFALMGRGKVAVDIYLQAEPGIFVIGDNANTPYSGMAQTALYDGTFVASNLKRLVSGKTLRSYKAKKPITVIPVGSGWAAVIWRRIHFAGYFGSLLRETAEVRGFHDLEPWSDAIKQYLSEYVSDT